MAFRWRQVLKLVLLLPILPVLAYGPVMHPILAFRALKEARKRLDEGDDSVNRDLVETAEANQETFTLAANSADAISANHMLNNMWIYDYAHNFVPDSGDGRPLFGYTLLDEWFRAREGNTPYPPRDLALAMGWLAHQLGDTYPHYTRCPLEAPEFEGYAESFRILGPDFHHEVLDQYKTVEHGLVEFFHDLIALFGPDGEPLREGVRLEFFEGGAGNLLTRTSERFGAAHRVRIPPEHLPSLKANFQAVIDGTVFLAHLVRRLQPKLHPNLLVKLGPDHARCLDQSTRDIVSGLFLKSRHELAQLARPLERLAGGPQGPRNRTGPERDGDQALQDRARPRSDGPAVRHEDRFQLPPVGAQRPTPQTEVWPGCAGCRCT